MLAGAALKDGETLLDVGCGDGLIAFGALQSNLTINVIFSDVSPDLLAHARSFHPRASATRSVLIYVDAKQEALREFHRVLKLGGRLSMFEPINIFNYEQPETSFWGLDVTPVVEAANKLKAHTRALQPPETDPMLNFDERDLLRMVEAAGFARVEMDYEVRIARWPETEWSTLVNQAPNPKLPTWDEAMNKVLTPSEKAAFIAHVRPQVENRQGIDRMAHAYLRATK